MRRVLPGLLVALTLAACGQAGDDASTAADKATPQNPFFGTWELTHARVAPWWDKPGEQPEADPQFTRFTFSAQAASGPPLLTCDKPRYAVDIVPVRGLFQGNLPDPPKDAAALGFQEPDVRTLSFSCQTGGADVLVDFAMVKDDTIVTAVSNVIYTFRLTGK